MIKKILSIILLFINTQQAVLGIDFGSNFFKGAIIVPGKPVIILENSASQRKSHNTVNFGKDKRVYEQDAFKLKTRFPEKTFNFVTKFLGANSQDKHIFEISEKYFENFLYHFNQERGTVEFTINHHNKKVVLSVEQVVAMILRYIKNLAKKQINQDIVDVVITIPHYFSFKQRQAIKVATKIAGLNLIFLSTENVAASLKHLISNQQSQYLNTTYTGVIYNMGADHISSTLIQIGAVNNTAKKNSTIDTLTILAEDSLQNVGGNAYSLELVNYFCAKFDEKHKKGDRQSIFENSKAKQKLFFEVDKLKEVLSANKESHLNVEQLLYDIDFHHIIKRSEFEDLIQPLLNLALIPLDNILKQGNVLKHELDFVEIIGGGTRIPIIQEKLQNYFGDSEKLKLGSRLNLYESPALGAAYLAANYSSHYRLKPMWLNDGFDVEFQMQILTLQDEHYNENEKQYNKNITLFPFRKTFKSNRSLQFSHSNNIQINIETIDRLGNKHLYMQYNLTNITQLRNHSDFENMQKPKIHIKFDLDSIDAVRLVEHEIWVNQTTFKNSTRIIRTNKLPESNNSTDSTTNSTIIQEEELKNNDGEVRYETITKKKIHLNQFQIKVTQKHFQIIEMSEEVIKNQTQYLNKLDQQETDLVQIIENKNKLESYLYELKEFLENEKWTQYYIKKEKEEYLKKIQENDKWLNSDEAADAELQDYKDRFKKLSELMAPLNLRIDEFNKRPTTINKTLEKIQDFQGKIERLNVTMPWINSTDIEPIQKELSEFIKYFEDVQVKASKQKLHEEPIFKTDDLKKRLNKINDIYKKIRAIPKTQEYKMKELEQKEEEANKKKQEREEKKKQRAEEKKKKEQEEKLKKEQQELEKLTNSTDKGTINLEEQKQQDKTDL